MPETPKPSCFDFIFSQATSELHFLFIRNMNIFVCGSFENFNLGISTGNPRSVKFLKDPRFIKRSRGHPEMSACFHESALQSNKDRAPNRFVAITPIKSHTLKRGIILFSTHQIGYRSRAPSDLDW